MKILGRQEKSISHYKLLQMVTTSSWSCVGNDIFKQLMYSLFKYVIFD